MTAEAVERVRVIGSKKPAPGTFFGDRRFNLLQEQRPFLWGWITSWVTIDEEEVPEHARISLGATGHAGWKSRFPPHLF